MDPQHPVFDLRSYPSPFLRAFQNDQYEKGDSEFSVTGLLSPPQRTWLALSHEKVETPYSAFAALMGTAIHGVLEANVDEAQGEIAEKRFFAELHGSIVSGKLDFYEHKTVFDYKSTRGVQEKMKSDHWLQVNMNAYLAIQNGLEVHNVGVVYIQMDWSYMQSTLNPTYPQSPFKIFIHPYDETVATTEFAIRIRDHQEAKKGSWRPCTPDEQWAKPDVYAVMSAGGKRAVNGGLCATMAEALAMQKPGQTIQTRKGELTFCDNFCGFSAHCEQYRRATMTMKNEIE